MKVGDLVWFVKPHNDRNMYGIIIEQVNEPLAFHHDVFKILWRDGTIDNHLATYDLCLVKNESR